MKLSIGSFVYYASAHGVEILRVAVSPEGKPRVESAWGESFHVDLTTGQAIEAFGEDSEPIIWPCTAEVKAVLKGLYTFVPDKEHYDWGNGS